MVGDDESWSTTDDIGGDGAVTMPLVQFCFRSSFQPRGVVFLSQLLYALTTCTSGQAQPWINKLAHAGRCFVKTFENVGT